MDEHDQERKSENLSHSFRGASASGHTCFSTSVNRASTSCRHRRDPWYRLYMTRMYRCACLKLRRSQCWSRRHIDLARMLRQVRIEQNNTARVLTYVSRRARPRAQIIAVTVFLLRAVSSCRRDSTFLIRSATNGSVFPGHILGRRQR